MEEEGRLFEEIIIDLVNTRATGALELTEDRKRWQFFFEDGELAASRSNLKSEQPDAITRELGPLDDATLNLHLAARRIAHACRATPTTSSSSPASAPPCTTPPTSGTSSSPRCRRPATRTTCASALAPS